MRALTEADKRTDEVSEAGEAIEAGEASEAGKEGMGV
jgi:hypothetical protein